MDEWPIRSARFNRGRGPVLVERQPTAAEERCDLARTFADNFDLPLDNPNVELLVDNPESNDPFLRIYAPWPLRLYLVRGGVIEWIAQPHDCSFDKAVVELMDILQLNTDP
mmetsp:Transcript_19201/g.28010  ORF Transcript_19201/g.28010 Transcript_19201/m.28010 type:complete len:111 (+) Transcript_19201:738-1070(+)